MCVWGGGGGGGRGLTGVLARVLSSRSKRRFAQAWHFDFFPSLGYTKKSNSRVVIEIAIRG